MIDLVQVRDLVIRPTLLALDAVDKGQYSLAAEQLMLGTLVTESNGKHLAQIGGGPAMGFWQVEPDTADDIWEHWLNYRSEIAACVDNLLADLPHRTQQLATNLPYACAMARQVYRRSPEPLPQKGDAAGMGQCWKKTYNTAAGRGDSDDFTRKFTSLIQPLYK